MFKPIYLTALLLFFINTFANTITLPALIPYDPIDPAHPFAADIVQTFQISVDASTQSSEKCKTTQPYMLTAFIYRGEVDQKFAAVYAPQDRSLTWCWINLRSYKSTLGYEGTQWDGPVWTPSIRQQVWCNRMGLLDPKECAVVNYSRA